MEFDSPEEVAKEFPGLYKKPDGQNEMSDPADYDDEDKKKKKDKKDSKKDKGYATLADENSQDEADADSHHAKKKLKGFKLSVKKKEKDKEHKVEKDAKKDKKLEKKKESTERNKSADREIPFSTVRIPFSADRHRDINAHRSSVPAAFFTSTPKSKDKDTGESSPVATVEKERSSSSALNAFLNAPAPLFLQKKKDKDKGKEAKKDKEKKEKEHKDKDKKEQLGHASGVAKVKLKLMRSKNSLDDPHEKGELHISVSHQFPEDPEALAKEIRKHEQLLEQTHSAMKSSKKVTKKQEEQLWETQRTLTALKRKLRSINALSIASVNVHGHCSNSIVHEASQKQDAEPLHVESSSNITGMKNPNSNNTIPSVVSSVSPIIEGSNAISEQNKALKKQGCETEDLSKLATVVAEKESPPKSNAIGIEQGCEPSTTVVQGQLGTDHSKEAITVIPPPIRKSARRSLDFSDCIEAEEKKPVKINQESRIPIACCSSDISCVEEEKVDPGQEVVKDADPDVHVEHEKVQVHVIVHQESKEEDEGVNGDDDDDDSSVASEEGEALPSISSRTEENEDIEHVLDDANAMIGSMHEELEAASLAFGQKLSRGGPGIFKHLVSVSKSEPTFGEQTNDSSDVELIRDEDDDELPESFNIDDLIPELLILPEFETPEYLIYENEQLGCFNKTIQGEIVKEEAELEAMMEELESIRANSDNLRTENAEDCDMERLITIWKSAKSENEALHANVTRLTNMVALSRLEEFKLETRLRFLEDKVLPISPITITTPLHSET